MAALIPEQNARVALRSLRSAGQELAHAVQALRDAGAPAARALAAAEQAEQLAAEAVRAVLDAVPAGTPGRDEHDQLVRPCIRRSFTGGQEDITYPEFAEDIIQDWDVAEDVADDLLAWPKQPREWNAEEPEFREVFELLDASDLKAQIAYYADQE